MLCSYPHTSMNGTTIMVEQKRGNKKVNPKDILLIDDNVGITGLFARYLKLKGLNCTISNDGKNGLEYIQTKQFDVILLDLSMPGFSGLEVIDAIENSGIIKEKRIYVFTASSITAKEIEELRSRGISGCIKKPVTVNQLLDHIGIKKD